MEYTEKWKSLNFDSIAELYESVGWSNYTREKEKLRLAFENSTFVLLAFDESDVIGLVRSVSDDVSIHYLQDILVSPLYQRSGVGRELVRRALERFAHVRTHSLLTDDEVKQKLFYKSLGFENVKDAREGKLNCFLKL